ncbi:MAG: Gfo/Idh/MocA family oxidoreductase [Actinomycetota bacterium]|nr:Gfo/Idh/MocA family oxidoreductase [Actinomycetota bacterium]
MVGFGYWGENLCRNASAAATTRLAGIADPSGPRRESAALAYPDVAVHDSVEKLLRDDAVEAVIVATPAATHRDVAIESLSEGRHVLVEKPLATSLAAAREIVAAGVVADRTVMVGHTFLFAPAVTWLKKFIDAGELGQLRYVYSQRLSLGRIRADCSALWNFAPHDLSIITHLIGEYPVEVSGRAFEFLQDGIADIAFATMSFASGAAAAVHVSWLDPRKTRLVAIVGDRKMAIYDDTSADRKIEIVDAGAERAPSEGYASFGEFQWKTRQGDIFVPRIPYGEPLRAEITAFGAACQGGSPQPSDGVHGVEIVQILEAIDRSIGAAGASVPIPR